MARTRAAKGWPSPLRKWISAASSLSKSSVVKRPVKRADSTSLARSNNRVNILEGTRQRDEQGAVAGATRAWASRDELCQRRFRPHEIGDAPADLGKLAFGHQVGIAPGAQSACQP